MALGRITVRERIAPEITASLWANAVGMANRVQ